MKPHPTDAPETGPTSPVSFFPNESISCQCLQKQIGLLFRRNHSLRQPPPVVLRHAVLPLEEVSDALRLDAHFDSPQACQQEVHFVAEADRSPQVFCGWLQLLYFSPADFKQAPASREFANMYHSSCCQVKSFASDAGLGLLAK